MTTEDKHSTEDKRSAGDIEADLERTRKELAASVDELSTMIDPRVQLRDAKQNVKDAVDRSMESAQHAVDGAESKARSLFDDVKQGDPTAIGIVGGGVAVVGGIITLLARRSR